MLLKNYSGFALEVGTDEAGRGCLAGPVTAAAVLLPPDFEHELLNDSKKLTEKQREYLRPIIEKEAISFAYTHLSPEVIDDINILQASIKAMQLSIGQLPSAPEYIIVDGNRFKPYNNIPYSCIVKGDAKYLSIAAASVLAKTYRDDYMHQIHQEYPMYNWKQNKGYPTLAHRDAIRQYGITPHHRKTFQLLPTQLSLEL